MKRGLIILLPVLVLAGLGYWAWTRFGYQFLPLTPTSFIDLSNSNSNQYCTYTENGIPSKIYQSEGKTRREIGNSIIIFDGYNSYSWSKNSQIGTKTPYDPTQTPLPKNASTSSFYSGLNTTYNCRPWAVDQSFFVPPANITFTAIPTPAATPKPLPKDFLPPTGK